MSKARVQKSPVILLWIRVAYDFEEQLQEHLDMKFCHANQESCCLSPSLLHINTDAVTLALKFTNSILVSSPKGNDVHRAKVGFASR